MSKSQRFGTGREILFKIGRKKISLTPHLVIMAFGAF